MVSEISVKMGSGIVAGNGFGSRGIAVKVTERTGDFYFSTGSRLAVRPTQPRLQRVPGAFLPELRESGREIDQTLFIFSTTFKKWSS
jgi:hypothetical protein